jgi:hypothetical protein
MPCASPFIEVAYPHCEFLCPLINHHDQCIVATFIFHNTHHFCLRPVLEVNERGQLNIIKYKQSSFASIILSCDTVRCPRANLIYLDTKMGKKTKSVGSYTCALCKRGFTRRATVKDPHFPRCVAKNGNPKDLVWDEHPSCWVKLPDGTKGKSGFNPPGVSLSRVDSDEVKRCVW